MKVDKTLPRMKKGKYSYRIISKDLWKRFIKDNPKYKNLEWSDFIKYWDDISETIREETVQNPLGVKLGNFNGELKLQYLPYQFKARDRATNEDHVNLVTRGKVAKLKWERRWAVKFNKVLQYFAFVPTRELQNRAKKYIDDNPNSLRVARNTLGGRSVWKQKN